ncbi:MAG TPA: hypothetical protein VF077_08225 [Nitrospiraceae bacterium]
MNEPQEIAEAISSGLNCIAEIEAMVKESVDSQTSSTPDPGWPETLHSMERALSAVALKTVTTAMVVGDEDIERIRHMRALISNWMVEGRPPPELGMLAAAIFRWVSAMDDGLED